MKMRKIENGDQFEYEGRLYEFIDGAMVLVEEPEPLNEGDVSKEKDNGLDSASIASKKILKCDDYSKPKFMVDYKYPYKMFLHFSDQEVRLNRLYLDLPKVITLQNNQKIMLVEKRLEDRNVFIYNARLIPDDINDFVPVKFMSKDVIYKE